MSERSCVPRRPGVQIHAWLWLAPSLAMQNTKRSGSVPLEEVFQFIHSSLSLRCHRQIDHCVVVVKLSLRHHRQMFALRRCSQIIITSSPKTIIPPRIICGYKSEFWYPNVWPKFLYCIRKLPSGGMYWEIYPPRFALAGRGVQNPRPREISSSEGDAFPNTSLLSAVYGFIIIPVASEFEKIHLQWGCISWTWW